MSLVFGPIPSRRLGRSLGINNIPPKVCSYSCIYCQIGATDSMTTARKEFYSINEIVREVSDKVKKLHDTNEPVDYLTFVPDGEPTLDINLGKEIDLLKALRIKIAVITNSSLLWDEDVRNDLMNADWVSVKIDTVDDKIWHKINRPNGKLELEKILSGTKTFALSYNGELVTETMLIRGVNDNIDSLTQTAKMVHEINPKKSYILVPTRPPAENFVEPPSVETLNLAYQIFNDYLSDVELLAYSEGTDFTFSSDVEKELSSILSVHPMSKEAIEIYLLKANADWQLINNLVDKNILKEVQYSGNKFFVKNIRRRINN
jgi:wyosine [tRNA(Phe)-imidazoG37] synthetase (radical SAM superfamily)